MLPSGNGLGTESGSRVCSGETMPGFSKDRPRNASATQQSCVIPGKAQSPAAPQGTCLLGHFPPSSCSNRKAVHLPAGAPTLSPVSKLFREMPGLPFPLLVSVTVSASCLSPHPLLEQRDVKTDSHLRAAQTVPSLSHLKCISVP